ncbi:peptidyl-dipeptidase dcp [Salmonella enterica subsp. enterica]|uniref:Peptidyl-dipeptidase dcp n=1 Tax=Salmonella enterica I TaxID=59201 RepID=A0A379URZ3_SALET|nr:peptidyl-dipeptidase dcp [Salmonella enterica subsp. enterica]
MDSGGKRRCPRYRAIVQRLVEIRRCQAKLLGFPNYAAWKMADQMAKTPQAALSFMRGIVPPARQRVLNEQAEFRTSLMVSRAATPFRPGTGCSMPNRYGGKNMR